MCGSDSTKTETGNTTLDKTEKEEQGKRPKFGPRPKFNNPNFDFKKELSQLPFPFIIGEMDMSKAQQQRFLELIYGNLSVLS